MIVSVLGGSRPAGFCQSHEHIFIRPCPAQAGQPIDEPEKSLAELAAYHTAGGRVLVDAQPVGCGRDAAILERLSRESGVEIIASTGFHKLSYYPAGHWIFSASGDELEELFTAELERGMYLDGDDAFPRKRGAAKAGQIKTALDTEGLTPRYVKLFLAAAAAARKTGRALMAHIERGSGPLTLAGFLEEQGLSRVIFCHTDRAVSDPGVRRELCRRGIFLEYDTIGRPKYHNDRKELDIVTELLEAGYEDRLLMGLDTTRDRLKSYGGIPGLSYIIEEFIPLMRNRGIGEAQIRKIFVENPAKVFNGGQAPDFPLPYPGRDIIELFRNLSF